MRSQSSLITLFAFLIGIIALACHKGNDLPPYTGPLPIDYTVLPPATQEGKNTIGCKINGKVWVPRVPFGAVTYTDVTAFFSEKSKLGYGNFALNLVDIDEKIQDWMSLGFNPSYFMQQDYHTSPDSTDIKRFFVSMQRLNNYYDIDYSKTNYSNRFTLTKIDTLQNFISGTFEFTLYRDNNKKDSLKITEGRFDLKYYPE
jgi:hypothetical protein